MTNHVFGRYVQCSLFAIFGLQCALLANPMSGTDEGGQVIVAWKTLKFSEYSKRFPGAFVEAFDISPDGTSVVVEFEVAEGNGVLAQWLTLWNTKTGELTSSKRVEESRPASRWSRQFGHDVRFVADGSRLLVLTGPRALVVDSTTLDILHELHPSNQVVKELNDKFVYKVAICHSPPRAALLRIPHRVYGETFNVSTYSIDDGKLLVQWTDEGLATNISYSQACDLIAVSTVSDLARSESNSLRIYSAGNGHSKQMISSYHSVGGVQFRPDVGQVLTIPRHHLNPELYPTDTIRVWDVITGELLREYEYQEFGLRGNMTISRDGRFMAAVTEWENPVDLRGDSGNIRSFSRLLLWNLSHNRKMYVSKNLENEIIFSYGQGKHLVRYSGNGKLLAVGGEAITLYRLESVN